MEMDSKPLIGWPPFVISILSYPSGIYKSWADKPLIQPGIYYFRLTLASFVISPDLKRHLAD